MDTGHLIERIVTRAMCRYKELKIKRRRFDIEMDIEVTHASCPLDLAKLLAADDFNFMHDVDGIARCLNHQTFELDKNFHPRCALPVES